jgi:hypothetical protein
MKIFAQKRSAPFLRPPRAAVPCLCPNSEKSYKAAHIQLFCFHCGYFVFIADLKTELPAHPLHCIVARRYLFMLRLPGAAGFGTTLRASRSDPLIPQIFSVDEEL